MSMGSSHSHEKRQVLFIYDNLTEFIRRDLAILRKDFDVIPHQYKGKKDILRIMIKIIKSDINLSRFVLGHATVAVLCSRIFRKKSIVIASGWDVVTIPEFGYGAMLNPKRVWKTKYALRHADIVTAESESLKHDVLKHVQRDVHVIYQGFDFEAYSPAGEKENLVLTVGSITKENFKRKGLEYFVRVSTYLPEAQFVLIGSFIDDSIDYLKSIAPPNLKLTGFVEEKELIDYYRKAKVYVQISAHEGFGCSLAEAMLCECVPVVTDKGAIPEVVGDTGFYVPYKDVEATAEAIREALSSNKGKDARDRVKNLFPSERRRESFRRLIYKLLKK